MTDDGRQKQCVCDGETVSVPCWALSKVSQYSMVKSGIVSWQYINMVTDKPGRTLYGAKAPQYPDGLVFNYCPFCGERHPGAYHAEVRAAVAAAEKLPD